MSKRVKKGKFKVLKTLSIVGLAGALLVPGLDLLAGPALIGILVSGAGGKK